MATLTSIANELLFPIFRALAFIDDAYHLARCCKHFNAVFERDRLIILRAIIVSSEASPYPLQAGMGLA
jgi:hypothetical protein